MKDFQESKPEVSGESCKETCTNTNPKNVALNNPQQDG